MSGTLYIALRSITEKIIKNCQSKRESYLYKKTVYVREDIEK